MPDDLSLPSPDATLALIRSRRTIHLFDGRAPDDALVERAIEAAVQAPNHRRTRPWRFYRLGEATRRALVERNTELVRQQKGEQAAANKQRAWEQIPVLLVVTSRLSDDPLRQLEDYGATCAAIQNLSLYLHSAGVASKWSTGGVTRDLRALELLGIDPLVERVAGLLMIGHAAQQPADEERSAEAVTVRLP
jgi:nitroreductase